MYLGQVRERLDEATSRCLVHELLLLPGKLETVLSADAHYEDLARKLSRNRFPVPRRSLFPHRWKARSN